MTSKLILQSWGRVFTNPVAALAICAGLSGLVYWIKKEKAHTNCTWNIFKHGDVGIITSYPSRYTYCLATCQRYFLTPFTISVDVVCDFTPMARAVRNREITAGAAAVSRSFPLWSLSFCFLSSSLLSALLSFIGTFTVKSVSGPPFLACRGVHRWNQIFR